MKEQMASMEFWVRSLAYWVDAEKTRPHSRNRTGIRRAKRMIRYFANEMIEKVVKGE